MTRVTAGSDRSAASAQGQSRAIAPAAPGEAIQSIHMPLAKAQSSIEDDESVELKPKAIRLREKPLDPIERKRDERRKEAERV